MFFRFLHGCRPQRLHLEQQEQRVSKRRIYSWTLYLARPTTRTTFAWWRKNWLLKVNTSCGPALQIFIYLWGIESCGDSICVSLEGSYDPPEGHLWTASVVIRILSTSFTLVSIFSVYCCSRYVLYLYVYTSQFERWLVYIDVLIVLLNCHVQYSTVLHKKETYTSVSPLQLPSGDMFESNIDNFGVYFWWLAFSIRLGLSPRVLINFQRRWNDFDLSFFIFILHTPERLVTIFRFVDADPLLKMVFSYV